MKVSQVMNAPFEFFEPMNNDLPPGSFILEVAPGIQSKSELLKSFSKAGRFPSYFGGNWDALLECLCDLSWLAERQVVVVHRDLPLSEVPAECRTYLEILGGAVAEWQRTTPLSKNASADLGPGHELKVYCPSSERSTVARAVA